MARYGVHDHAPVPGQSGREFQRPLRSCDTVQRCCSVGEDYWLCLFPEFVGLLLAGPHPQPHEQPPVSTFLPVLANLVTRLATFESLSFASTQEMFTVMR